MTRLVLASQLVLASKSAARAEVMRGAGLTFATTAAPVDEGVLKRGLKGRGATPREVAHVLAEEKAKAASLEHAGLVIGADQTLDLDGSLMDKAESLDEARAHLTALRGREHKLHSGLAVAEAGEIVFTTVETATLSVRPFSSAWLDDYLERNGEELLGCVGAYKLEGEGAQLFERVEGDYFVVLGMPLLALLRFLRERGVLPA